MSCDVIWGVTRNNSAFLLKKRNCPKPFSMDPMNLTNRHSKRYTGLVQRKAVGIAPGPGNKGFTVTMKRTKKGHKPVSSLLSVTMKAGPRRSLHKLRSLVKHYRRDLTKASLQRASVILRSQKPLPTKKGATKATKPAKPAKKTE